MPERRAHAARPPRIRHRGECRSRVLFVGDHKRCRALLADRCHARGLHMVEARTPLDAIVHLQAEEWNTSVVMAGSLATIDRDTFMAFLDEAFPEVEIMEPCGDGTD